MFNLKHLTPRSDDLATWLLSLFAWLSVGVMMAAWYNTESTRVLAAENERLAALAKILVKDVAVNLAAVDRSLAGVIRDRLAEGGAVDTAAVDKRLRALVEAMPGVRGITVIDAAGIVIAGVPDDLVGRDFSQRAYFTVPRQRGEVPLLYLSPPFRSIRGDVVISVTRMVPAAARFNGVVSAVLDPGYFSGILQTALYAPDMRAAIVHAAGGRFVEAGASASTAAGIATSADIAPAHAAVDSALSLQLWRDRAVVMAPLHRQAALFAALYGATGLFWAATLVYRQSRRQRLELEQSERKRERLQAEALAASEARFRTLIEEAPVAVAMARQGRFIYTNRRYNLLHGYHADQDLTGLTWGAMIAPPSLAALSQQLASLNADAAVEQRFEAVGLGKDGAQIPVLKATTRVAVSDGPATLIFVQDISAQKTAESHLLEARDAAEAANRSKAEFLANMSHEIRTPLNAILGLAYLLERTNQDHEAAAMLQKIRGAGRSLLGIINDILDVSKIEAGAMVIESSWFSLQEVIDNVAATMGVAVGDKPIALLVAPLPTLAASVRGDALRLEQLLVNLTSNAIKFTEGGSVSLTVDAQLLADGQAELLFRVTDTGIGIPRSQQRNIFSPFTQADSSTTRRYGGSGLGLTICKQIVALMQGRIGVDSIEGSGSSFWFALPLPLRAAPAGSSSPEMAGMEVLLIGAAGAVPSTLPDTALALGWHLRHAVIGRAAARDLERRAPPQLPGVILIEWRPDGDALNTMQAIRDVVPAGACPIVILVSAFQANAADAVAAARTLADAVLTTPVTTSTLYNAVLEARRRRAGQDDGATLAMPAPVRRAGNALSALRILVVDDSEINRDVAQRILEGEGARVALAEHGRAAIDWLLAHPNGTDLVLMDVQMPVMDGIEATRILRSMAQFTDLPIVALTAGAFSSHQEAARGAGMDHFIAKPFDVAATISLIGRLAGGRGGPGTVLAASTAAPNPAPVPLTIDVGAGVRTWGSLTALQRYLRKFATSFDDAGALIRADLDSGARQAAAAAAHKLAGAASGVALTTVSALALQLEQELSALRDGQPTLLRLEAALDAALTDIASLAPVPLEAAPAPSAAAAGPQAQAAPLIGALIEALAENTPAPPTRALAALAPWFADEAVAPIRACIDDFDWPGATLLACELGASLTEPRSVDEPNLGNS